MLLVSRKSLVRFFLLDRTVPFEHTRGKGKRNTNTFAQERARDVIKDRKVIDSFAITSPESVSESEVVAERFSHSVRPKTRRRISY